MSSAAKTSVGIGPFKISGQMDYSEKEDHVKSLVQSNSITIETPQIIGFISSVVKMSPKNE